MNSSVTELIPGLPEEIALECLTRLPYSAHRASSRVCRRWNQLLQSSEFYHHRKKSNNTQKAACLIQAVPSQSESKPVSPPSYGVSIFDPVSQVWERVDSVPNYPNGLPLFSQLTSSEGKLVLMGGWDPLSWNPVKHVFVYDFTTRRWRQGNDMPEQRSFFAADAVAGKVFVAGGHDVSKNALNSAWVYDVRNDEWTELTRMTQERDECEGIIIGSEFWVVSGYSTENQGRFVDSAEYYESGSGQWVIVNGSWDLGRCPRSCVGVGKDGKLVSWAESDSKVRFGSCGVDLGDRVFVAGSEYQGGPQGVYLEGQNGKLERVSSVAEDFLGFIQSGCCVEI